MNGLTPKAAVQKGADFPFEDRRPGKIRDPPSHDLFGREVVKTAVGGVYAQMAVVPGNKGHGLVQGVDDLVFKPDVSLGFDLVEGEGQIVGHLGKQRLLLGNMGKGPGNGNGQDAVYPALELEAVRECSPSTAFGQKRAGRAFARRIIDDRDLFSV